MDGQVNAALATEWPAFAPALRAGPVGQDVVEVAARSPLSGEPLLTASTRDSADRATLERFVAEAFRRQHGAQVRSFMPTLLGLYRRDGSVGGVAGIRPAATESLYLEQYLDAPVEIALSARLGFTVDRASITEVGNLATDNCRMARRLMTLLPQYLLDLGQDWVVFTATSVVRDILESIGTVLLELGAADGQCVATSPDQWGRYYQNNPRVMAARVSASLHLAPRRRHRA
jgi:hypothetical protein